MLFKKAENQSAYLKAGILGFAGSGKSRTSTEIAIGLHKFIKTNKPVFYLDTETGSDFLKLLFDKAKIELYVNKSRAFVDLLAAVDEAESKEAILIIDSITHFWTELMNAFKKKKKIDRLFFQHWGPIKEEWGQFTQKYVNSKCHIIMAGRAGWEYDYEKDDEGVKELVKTGTKMRAESEMGYEPSLLIEMEKIRNADVKGKVGGAFSHRAWIVKDRFDMINGKFFDNPTFKDFLPHVSLLNIGGEHIGVESGRNSEALFNSDRSVSERLRQRDIYLEEINAELELKFNGRTDEGKKNRIKSLVEIFGSASKTAIENLDNEKLKNGLEKIKTMKGAEENAGDDKHK